MRTKLFVLISLFFCATGFAQNQETLTITTYYPSPFGSYNEMRARRVAIGDAYITSAYCWPPTSCTNQVNANADLVVEGNVGIGTFTPNNAIQVANLINFDNTVSGTFLGYQAGNANGSSGGYYNTFVGYQAGSRNTSGDQNTFFGCGTGVMNTTTANNSFFGYFSGNKSIGDRDTFVGAFAGLNNTTGYDNSFFGQGSGTFNNTGHDNSFLGSDAGYSNTTGNNNTFVGRFSGYDNTIGNENTFVGYRSGENNIDAQYNTFVGNYTGQANTTGVNNTFIGYIAGQTNTTGNGDTFVGSNAGKAATTGGANTFLGVNSGQSITTGGSNTFLGYDAGNNASQKIDATNSMALGTGAYTTANDQIVIGNTSIVDTYLNGRVTIGTTGSVPEHDLIIKEGHLQVEGASPEYRIVRTGYAPTYQFVTQDRAGFLYLNIGVVNGATPLTLAQGGAVGVNFPSNRSCSYALEVVGQGGATAGFTTISDARLKQDIVPLSNVLDKLQQIHGVYFKWNKQYQAFGGASSNHREIGLIAQDVKAVFPELISSGKDKEGYLWVDYGKFTAVLLEAVKELEVKTEEIVKENTALSKRIDALEKRIK